MNSSSARSRGLAGFLDYAPPPHHLRSARHELMSTPCPTRVRYALLGVATANAFLLYLDRICMTTIVHSQSFTRDFGLSDGQVGNVLACGIVAFATDSAGPAIWAISQDIGRAHTAATMPWSNMWGNLGASAVAKWIPLALASPLHRADWSEVFWMCASGFIVLAIVILFVDSTRPLLREGQNMV